MVKNVANYFNTNLFFSKLVACIVLFCIVVSSAEIISVNTNISVMQSAKVSADTLISQFFYISSFPIDVITSMFVEKNQQDGLATSKAQDNSDKKNNEGSSAKASLGYSILPNTINLLYFSKTNILKTNKYANYIGKFTLFDYSILRCSYFQNLNLLVELNIIMMLLLTILLSRRKLSDDNVVIQIINNKKKIARLV